MNPPRRHELLETVHRAKPWKLEDVLDFEYLLANDQTEDSAAVPARDRSQLGRREILHHWLEARRKATRAPLPGRHFVAGWQSLLVLAALAGLGIGASLTAGLLHYKGDEPVNVAWFFAATVGVQWLLLIGALLVWLLRKTTRAFDDFAPLRWMLSALLWSFSAGLRRLPGEQRARLQATLATISHRREIYGSLAVWPILMVTQLFGVLFNLGVLATLLLQVALSDVAFGWQSTLHTSPEEAHRIVTAIAAPWSWAPNAHPTYEQVVASRFAYSEGIAPLSKAAMAAWWPFLSYAVAVYGLLVRLALLLLSAASLRRGLRSLAFDHQECNALLRRLTGPMIQAQGEPAAAPLPGSDEVARIQPRQGQCLALVATELKLATETIESGIRASLGWQVTQSLAAQVDLPSGNAEALAAAAEAAERGDGIVILVPARRAPIKAIALFLRRVAAAPAEKRDKSDNQDNQDKKRDIQDIVVLLVGRSAESGFFPVEDEDFQHWRNFNSIQGLHLGIEKWRAE